MCLLIESNRNYTFHFHFLISPYPTKRFGTLTCLNEFTNDYKFGVEKIFRIATSSRKIKGDFKKEVLYRKDHKRFKSPRTCKTQSIFFTFKKTGIII